MNHRILQLNVSGVSLGAGIVGLGSCGAHTNEMCFTQYGPLIDGGVLPRHLMLVPSLACPASCAYCFGPHEGGALMAQATVGGVVRWQNALGGDDAIEITFHGGEPLVPGIQFYRMALPLLRQGLAPRRVQFAMQSNLWLLTDELCNLLREYGVSLGTSLDGPESINDAQRGQGHFRRTMAGIERARAHGIHVGCICTFTAQSARLAQDIFDFFVREGLNFTVHAAVPSLRYPDVNGRSLSPEVHGELLVDMLDRYLQNLDRIRISTLDSMCQSVSAERGGICTFGDCLGGYLAVAPDGGIYPCQRFSAMPEYRLGNVDDCPSAQALATSAVWRMFQARQERMAEECKGCDHLDICRGGCPYNVLATDGRSLSSLGKPSGLRDPGCPAYKRVFSYITERAVQKALSEENLEEVVLRVDPRKGLLRRGRLLSIMREGPHPQETARHARRILAVVALAATGSPAEAARKLHGLGLTPNPERTQTALRAYQERLNAPAHGLNNLYLHVTFACNLRCTHCYAEAGQSRKGELSVDSLVRAVHEAARLGFRHAVITGGEPLVHSQRDVLLDALAELRQGVRPLLTVLRTNLALSMDDALLRRIAHSTDEVVVSVDGDRYTHDERRGTGQFDATVSSLRKLVEMGCTTDLSLATVLPLNEANGAPGDAVRALARVLRIRRTRFRPVLPLGRAVESDIDIVPETLWGHIDPRDMMEYGFNPVASCGIGQNLYVEPDGSAYPCYACHGGPWRLGEIDGEEGLQGVVQSAAFQDLGRHTVTTNRQCRSCPLRYLCGGACRAWSRNPESAQTDLDAPPLDCFPLHLRARSLLVSALERMQISPEQWLAADLPLPDSAPMRESY
jgi:uncharacterized protein